MSYTLKHISIRVPWHDTGLNGACLKLERIAEDRDDDAEESVAGQSIKDTTGCSGRSAVRPAAEPEH